MAEREGIDKIKEFAEERKSDSSRMAEDKMVAELGIDFIMKTLKYKYSYNYSWLGRPVIQLPEDMLIMGEVIWSVKPDLIVETGIAHGGSLIFHASMLELIGGDRSVLGVDIDIREHNRVEIEKHHMYKRISMIEGSSIDEKVVGEVFDVAKNRERVLVVLDSNHTHEHVLEELNLYSPLVQKGGYIIVLDTVIEDLPGDSFPDRPWGKGNNPKTAVMEFISKTDRFEVDREIDNKLVITSAPMGFLKCTGNSRKV